VERSYTDSIQFLQRRGFAPRTVIDIGAAEGAFFLIRQGGKLCPGAQHFFIDAMHENEPVYQAIGKKFGTGYEITALSCLEGEVDLRIDPHFYNTHIDRLQSDTTYAGTRRVKLSTLDAVALRHELEPPYLLLLDVQGGELDVLRGALKVLDEAIIVTAEIQIFFERDTLGELISFMAGNGWALYDLTNPAYFSDGSFYQCYATFVPKSMDFRSAADWAGADKERILGVLRERRAGNLKQIEALLLDH
jgi:FkbM family methyltransferase